jgi:DNA helicase MCM8
MISADGGTPITTRQLESMVRLAEARAKLELVEPLWVTREHAADVVEIMKESLYDLFSDEHGHVDFRRTSGMSKPKQVSRFAKHACTCVWSSYVLTMTGCLF